MPETANRQQPIAIRSPFSLGTSKHRARIRAIPTTTFVYRFGRPWAGESSRDDGTKRHCLYVQETAKQTLADLRLQAPRQATELHLTSWGASTSTKLLTRTRRQW